MTIIKNLSKTIVSKNPNFHVREDLNFSDDGNRFRGFDYKGMPITTLRADNETYLSIRVDYLNNNFTYNEWMGTEEWKLADEFNGVSEIDLDKLIDNLEKVIAKVDAMNKAAETESIDMTDVKEKAASQVAKIDAAINKAKSIDWWKMQDYELREIKDYMTSLVRDKLRLMNTDFDNLSIRDKKEWKQRTMPGDWYIQRINEMCK